MLSSKALLRLLIVCTGNICRSPIADGLLVTRLVPLGGGIEVRSAGTWGRKGSPATPEAVSAAAQHGIDIQAHRSSTFTADLADRADLIITMTSEQAEEVLAEAPDAGPKTFTLKELVAILRSLPPVPSGNPTRDGLLRRIADAAGARSAAGYGAPADLDVADPLGLSETMYRAIAKELEGLVDELMRGLVGGREALRAEAEPRG
jgi:protein-tyrosine phosphatase